MLSFHVKFVQIDRRTDRRTTVKQYAPDLSMWGHKNFRLANLKASASNSHLTQIMKSVFELVEYILGKEENPG